MVFALAGMLLAVGRIEAQQSSPLMQASSVWNAPVQAETPPALVVRTAGSSKSYWLEGLVIGGALGGIAGGLIANAGCGDSDSGYSGSCTGLTFLGGLVGAVIGGVPGALIGGRFHKKEKAGEAAPQE